MTTVPIAYKDYIITPSYEPGFYEYFHKDWDGGIDPEDFRCGIGKSVEDCKQQIDNKEE